MKRLYHRLYQPFFRYFRTRRMQDFAREFALKPEMRVLDVGGTPYNWGLLPQKPRLVLLNLGVSGKKAERPLQVKGDGRFLPFKDSVFEIVYSNSVIEHLGTFDNQCLFAAECQRVGHSYYVQTPNRWFFFEPHYLTPFIHWLPRSIRLHLLRYCTIWGLLTQPTPQECRARIEEIRLLTERELRQLFPDADIWYERLSGITKSFMAVRNRHKGTTT